MSRAKLKKGQVNKVDAVTWETVHGKPGRRVYRLGARTIRRAETIPPLVEGL